MPHTSLISSVQNAVAQLAADFDTGKITVEHPNDLSHGDYATNAAMQLAGILQKNPLDIANELKELLEQDEQLKDVIAEMSVAAPGFLNFTLAKDFFLKEVTSILDQKDDYGKQGLGKGQKALIEYSQMNVAKPMHVGHLRTMILGDSLKRLYAFLGFETMSDTHYGDWGTQFGMVLYAYKHWGEKENVEEAPVAELVRLYVEMDKKVEEDPELLEKAKAEFKLLEDGDKENKELWQWFVEASVGVFDEIYDLMGILPFEYHLGESFYEERMKKEIDRLLQSGVATQEGEMIYVDLEEYDLGRCMLRKSDGATTYHLRDLATYTYRIEELGVGRNLYVVDSRQRHHFNQLFKIIELLGLSGVEGTEHVDYGFVTLPEGSLSTRKGRIVQAMDVVKQGVDKAREVIEEKNPDLERKDDVAVEVARAAIKFANLSANRHTDIVFEWDNVLRFDGDTGPYLQYTYARIQSILRKAEVNPAVDSELDLTGAEQLVLRQLYRFPEEIEKSYRDNDPHHLAQYLLTVAHAFNTFYNEVPVLQADDEKLIQQRLALTASMGQILKNGLQLLGINTVDRM